VNTPLPAPEAGRVEQTRRVGFVADQYFQRRPCVGIYQPQF